MNIMNRCKRMLLVVAWAATLSQGRETKEEAGTYILNIFRTILPTVFLTFCFEAVLARELLVSSPNPIATMATIYPNDHATLPG